VQCRLIATRDEVERDVTRPHDAVSNREGEGAVAERFRDTERDDQESGHGAQHDEANQALFGLDEAREPRVAHPRPPQHREHEHPAADPGPVRLGLHQGGALCEAEHEDKVEEELERLDRLSLAQLRAEPRETFPGNSSPHHEPQLVHAGSRFRLLLRAGREIAIGG
jgi:hypothetical protein